MGEDMMAWDSSLPPPRSWERQPATRCLQGEGDREKDNKQHPHTQQHRDAHTEWHSCSRQWVSRQRHGCPDRGAGQTSPWLCCCLRPVPVKCLCQYAPRPLGQLADWSKYNCIYKFQTIILLLAVLTIKHVFYSRSPPNLMEGLCPKQNISTQW